MVETCVVGVQLGISVIVKAFDVCISDAGDVYVNYSMAGIPEAHVSYHASGQQHTKMGGKYTPDAKLMTMPPKHVITRKACQDSIAWKIAELHTALPTLTGIADMVVDASGLSQSELLLFKIWVVGSWAKEHHIQPGFTKLKTHRFGSSVSVEIEAFEALPTAHTIISTSTFF
jgi:hypothetical protein